MQLFGLALIKTSCVCKIHGFCHKDTKAQRMHQGRGSETRPPEGFRDESFRRGRGIGSNIFIEINQPMINNLNLEGFKNLQGLGQKNHLARIVTDL